MQTKPYDIIIAGTGLSGFTLALELIRRPFFRDKRILLLDRDVKKANDRTWCFWAVPEEPLPPVLAKTWNHCWFYSPGFAHKMTIAPYRYCMVRGADFYRWALKQIDRAPNISRIQTTITRLDAANGQVHTHAGVFQGGLVFNSALTKIPVLPKPTEDYPNPPLTPEQTEGRGDKAIFLLQHFKGWLIQTRHPAFDPDAVTFMDFRIEQAGETRFVYVLPLSETEALVEFTIFSPALLPQKAYETALADYLREYLGIDDYRIMEEEFGVIPMTDFPFPAAREGKVIHIGTAGGFVKASSGYAFKRTQRKLRAFVADWERNGTPDPAVLRSEKIYRAFDSIFLRVLCNQTILGREIFESLFRKLPPDLVLRFLDEDSTFVDNLRLISAPPARPFLRAFFDQISALRRV